MVRDQRGELVPQRFDQRGWQSRHGRLPGAIGFDTSSPTRVRACTPSATRTPNATSAPIRATSYSIFSFTRKITQSLGGAAGAWLLGWAGYVGGAATQSESALTAIRASIGLVPAVMAIIAMIVFWKYPLNDARFREIRNEVEARKAKLETVVVGEGHVVTK